MSPIDRRLEGGRWGGEGEEKRERGGEVEVYHGSPQVEGAFALACKHRFDSRATSPIEFDLCFPLAEVNNISCAVNLAERGDSCIE